MAPFLLLTSSIGKTCGVRAKSVDRGSAEQGSSDIYSNSPVHGVDTGSSDSDSNAVNSAATGSSNRDGGLGPGVGDTESSNSDSIENNVTSREPFASNEYSRVTNNLGEPTALAAIGVSIVVQNEPMGQIYRRDAPKYIY